MIPRSVYDKLTSKPPMAAVNKVGLGISGQKFDFDGVCHMSMQFDEQEEHTYAMDYEPILISSNITTCIFGIHSERRFKGAMRDHDERTLKFPERQDCSNFDPIF